MALSVPVNGLKEGDKEPVIELFVKVKAEGWWPGSGAERAAPRPLVAPSPNRRFPALRRGWRGGGGSKFSSATRSGPLLPGGPGRGGDRAPPSPPTVGAPFLSSPPPPPPPNSLRPGARRDGGCLLTAAPGSAVGDASSFGSVRGGWVQKGPSVGEGLRVGVCVRSGEGVRGTGGESVCTDGGSVAANRK